MLEEKRIQFYYDLAIKKLPILVFDFWKQFKTTFQVVKNQNGYEMIFIRDAIKDNIIGIYYIYESKWLYLHNLNTYSEDQYLKLIKLKAFI